MNCTHHTSAVPHPFFCWLLPIWPKLDFWAKNGAYGLRRLGWCYNRAKLSFSWPYMLVSMIWNTSKLSALHLIRATAIFVVNCCQFGPSWIFGLKMELMTCASLVCSTSEQSCLFPFLTCYCQWCVILPKCLHRTSAVPHPFLLLIAANLAQAGCLYYQCYETLPNSLHHTVSFLGMFSPI